MTKAHVTRTEPGGETTEYEVDLAGPIPRADIPHATIEELVSAKLRAGDLSRAFGDAIKAQAEKYKVKPGALRRYVTAMAADKIEDAKRETDDLSRLLEA